MWKLKNKINDKPDWSFTNDAVKKIVNSFIKKKNSRFLLLIPTGGGKTLTAIRAINELVNRGELSTEKRVLWVVHMKSLRIQTEKEIFKEKNILDWKFNKYLSKVIEVKMKTESERILLGSSLNQYRLIIIDEAHHSEAATYQSFFRNDIGILGLTATPTRNDGKKLKFDDDLYYSISFRELVERRVLLKPEIISLNTKITINARNLSFKSTDNQLDAFNTDNRNKLICSMIFRKIEQYNLNKIIIFVGTNNHVKALYGVLNEYNQLHRNKIKHVGFIYGENNDRGISNEEYLENHAKMKSSILVNCRILNEGYNDPSLEAVVMATPTNSMLYYVQCIGRVVRNPESGHRKAFVLEMVDKLPNVRYRIDNRCLFSEISDYLEPEIIDILFSNKFDLQMKIKKIFIKYNVENKYYSYLSKIQAKNMSMLLLNDIPDDFNNTWQPLLFTTDKKNIYTNAFNMISNNIDDYYHAAYTTLIKKLNIPDDDLFFSYRPFRIAFFISLYEAYKLKQNNQKVNNIKYFIFNQKKLNFFQYWLYWIYCRIKYKLIN